MALLTSADFADMIGAKLLIQLTTDTPNAVAPDEDAIDVTSTGAWSEMWEYLGGRYVKPATVPAGSAKELLLTITRYRLYLRHPEFLATPEGEVVRMTYDDAVKRLKAVRDGDNAISGLTLLTTDELEDAGAGALYYANDVVYSKTEYRGF